MLDSQEESGKEDVQRKCAYSNMSVGEGLPEIGWKVNTLVGASERQILGQDERTPAAVLRPHDEAG